ncbi:glycosyltransferase [Micromonospora sp. NBC_01813]|uniref:glycosyltransferase n=1 Tax=Micromonospora sp. NBC_01813 TaxID=2975988 RepID=UPI002DDB3489|nr:glycosyltransferase [Micromonospora sp. NBC_01813]WSA10303.1 glycosyltransferase [Micromonospora sp. NBC_01813]
MTILADRSVALVHEWFGATGGSEQVFRHIADVVPHARRFVLWKDPGVTEVGLQESWLARTPLRHSKTIALPVMPLVWRTLSREHFDVVLSSSHAFAHTVRLGQPGHTRHLSYIHSPARYVWSPDFDGRGSGPLLAMPRRALQTVDVRLSRHVDSYAANSREVQARIRRFWDRDSIVIHPPVDVEYFVAAPSSDTVQSRDYLLGIGRWIPYKNFDLIISIAAAARMPLIIAGSGPEEDNLRKHADRIGAEVTFEVRPDRDRLRQLYWGARALLFPVHEDFGIIPVEAQACGTPVLGLRRGGLLETVVDGETGFLIDSTRAEDYVPLLRRLGELDPAQIQAHAKMFSGTEFAAKLTAWMNNECP